MRRTTMTDVARRAGVSQATVSLVLNDVAGSGIAVETKKRVRAAAAELGYRHNAIARGLKLQRSDTIGFVSEHITTTPYAVGLVQGAQDAAKAAGKHLLIVNVEYEVGEPHVVAEQRAIEELIERRVDGIVFASMFHRVIDVPAALREARSVLLDARAADASVASIVPDDYQAAATATTHLLDLGHRHVVHLTLPLGPPAAVLRRNGFMDAFHQIDVEPDPGWIVEAEPTTVGAYEAVLEVLAAPVAPTAIFCFNDQMALGVYQAASSLSLAIPDDVSVMGFDDIQLIAPALRPGLTTMRLPHYEMGQWAVQHLLSGEEAPMQELMDCPIVERGSVALPHH